MAIIHCVLQCIFTARCHA